MNLKIPNFMKKPTPSTPKGNSAVIIHCNDSLHYDFYRYVCPCRDCEGLSWDDVNSPQEADSLGWKFTTDIMFSQHGDVVGVCPDCASRNEGDWTR